MQRNTSCNANLSYIAESSKPIELVFFYVLCIQCFLTFLGNSFTIITLCTSRRLRTTSNSFLINLAATDLLSSVAMFISIILKLEPTIARAPWIGLCHFYNVLKHFSDGGRIDAILLIGLERFVYIVYPMKYIHIFSWRNIGGLISIAWIKCFLTYTIRLPYTHMREHGNRCDPWQMVPDAIVTVALSIGLVQICIVVVLYSIIFRLARTLRWGTPYAKSSLNRHNKGRLLRSLLTGRLLRMAFLVLVLFILLTVPGIVYLLLVTQGVVQRGAHHDVELVLAFLWNLNGFMNPLVYAWQSQMIRTNALRLLKCSQYRTTMTYL